MCGDLKLESAMENIIMSVARILIVLTVMIIFQMSRYLDSQKIITVIMLELSC